MTTPSSYVKSVPRQTRVLLADPQPLVREALRALLPPDHTVVGCATDGATLVREAARLKPDLVVSELTLPRLDGLDAARRIRQESPKTRVVFLTSVESEDAAAEGFSAGASGYLLKSSTAAEFIAGLRAVMRGHRTLSRRLAGGYPENLPVRPQPRTTGGKLRLSPRAADVVRLLAQGLAMKEVGAILGIATRTVAFHKYRAMECLGIGSSAELVRFAVESGLVERTPSPAAWAPVAQGLAVGAA